VEAAEGGLKLVRRQKDPPTAASGAMGSDSPEPFSSSADWAMNEEAVPLEPPSDSPLDLNPDQATVVNESSTDAEPDGAHGFWNRIISGMVEQLPPVGIAAEEEGRDGLKEALHRVKAKRLLAKLVEEEEEQKVRAQQQHVAHRSSRVKTYQPVPTFAYLRGLKSISKAEAAEYLRCTPRTIRNYVSKKTLNATPSKRVVCDDKLFRLLRRTHGDSVLP
jgi:hypothetical protein